MTPGGTLRVLLLGGYGTFGGRLARLLAGNPQVSLLIAGRALERAQSFCRGLALGAGREAVVFDRDGDVVGQLARIAPDVLVDASGPFQGYGPDPYRVVRACLTLGVDYLDLADGADFVIGIDRFDREACERGVFILSGVSSFPVLSAAVVRRLAVGLTRVASITGGIAPSPYAGVGVNVIRAIASYSGKPLALIRGGRRTSGGAMTESMYYTVSPPGQVPLRCIRFSLVDVPDLQVLPLSWPGLDSVWLGAGPVPELLHRILNALAWLVRLRVLPSLLPLASMIHWVSNRVRWGEHRGGMFVAVTGENAQGAVCSASWHLIAEGDDGPLIPSMACQALIERLLEGIRPASGARVATRELELEDYEALFARRTIVSGVRTSMAESADQPLYRRLLADAWDRLPGRLREMHGTQGTRTAVGRAFVRRGPNPLARWVAAVAGFPTDADDVPLRVSFERKAAGEWWTRDFNGRRFSSFQSMGRGRSEKLLCERFGPLSFDLALVAERATLSFVVRGWSLWGIRLPPALAPFGDSHEFVENDRFCFHIEIRHRWLGLIVSYRGWLERDLPIGREGGADA